MVNLARKSVGRKPFGHRVRIEERPIDLLGRGTQHAVKPDGVGRHYLLLTLGESSSSKRQSLRRGSPPPNDPAMSGLRPRALAVSSPFPRGSAPSPGWAARIGASCSPLRPVERDRAGRRRNDRGLLDPAKPNLFHQLGWHTSCVW